MKGLIVTADDFGLAEEINRGVVDAHRRGVVTCASLMIAAPATEHALDLASGCPDLEIGIHLALVEGYCVTGGPTLIDDEPYLPPAPSGQSCLLRDWRRFVRRYVTRQVDLDEVETEMRAQLELFRGRFGTIPFANVTQHLHLLPGIGARLIALAKEYRIGALRSTSCAAWSRFPTGPAVAALGRLFRARMGRAGIASTARFRGFEVSCRLTESRLARWLHDLATHGATEVMTHPGYECAALRLTLPRSHGRTQWRQELAALTSDRIGASVRANGIRLMRFHDLSPGGHGS